MVLPRRLLAAGALVLAIAIVGLVLALAPEPRAAVARVLAPRATADTATLVQQRTAAEHSIQRGYAKAVGQLRQVRELTLAIGRDEADTIDAKARGALRETRRQALGALGGVLGVPEPRVGDYVVAAESQLDQGAFESEPGLLLAPSLFNIVRRADQLFQATADDATRALTRAPSTPSASPPPAPPSASPSGR